MQLNEILLNIDNIEIELPPIPQVNPNPQEFYGLRFMVYSKLFHLSREYEPDDIPFIYDIKPSQTGSHMAKVKKEFESYENLESFFNDPAFANFALTEPDLDFDNITDVTPIWRLEPDDDES